MAELPLNVHKMKLYFHVSNVDRGTAGAEVEVVIVNVKGDDAKILDAIEAFTHARKGAEEVVEMQIGFGACASAFDWTSHR